jgi:tetratricopeptide (TPR) repeat protein
MPPLPAGHLGVDEQTFGVLTNIPLVWLALAVPLAWRSRSAEARSSLCGFLAAVAALFGISALSMSLFFATCARYEAEFLPALVLLAVIGILSLERALTCQPLRQRAMRWGWSLLLVFSVAFNLLTSVERCAEAHNNLGAALSRAGRQREAMGHFEQALRLKPDSAEAHYNLGGALMGQGRLQEAIGHYEQALRIRVRYAEAHNNLGVAFVQLGRVQEAIAHFEQALRINPDYAEAHCNLGNALREQGQIPQAIEQYEQALKLRPDFIAAKNALAQLRNGQ